MRFRSRWCERSVGYLATRELAHWESLHTCLWSISFPRWRFQTFGCLSDISRECSCCKKKRKRNHTKKKKLAGSVMANMAAPTRNTFMCMYTHTHANVRETVTPFTLTLPRLPLDGYVLYVLRQTAILMACHKLTNQLRMIRYLEPLK